MIDFDAINRAAMPILPALCQRWLPGGKLVGREYVARNPRRADRRPGSFSINTKTGRWADFASGETGGDPVSLAAFIFGGVAMEVDDAMRDGLASKWGIDGPALLDKLGSLNPGEQIALVDWIERQRARTA